VTDHLTQGRLDELWNFDDASESELRIREELTRVPAGSHIAPELTTQLARAIGLQNRFDEADALLDSVDDGSGVVLARTLLERGRLRNSGGHPDAAIPLFEEALAAASAVGNDFLAIDAAHMLGIADPARIEHWTARALETVDETTDRRAKRWAVSLHNNLGWALSNAGNLTGALAEFELAADAARDFGTPQQQVWAQKAIDEVVAALGKRTPPTS
jgi:tetratricopeptide (TPR) repeat protein